MKAIVVLFSLLIIPINGSSDLFVNQKEMQVALSILEHLNIHDCTFVSETLNITNAYPLASQIKRISSKSLSASFWTPYNFGDWAEMNKKMYHKKAFIIKRLGLIQDYIMYYRYDLSDLMKYIWLVFDDDIKLFIPYDCEFIRVQKMDENTYKLAEMYNIKNQTFVQNIGIWDISSGLKLTNSTSYWRRLNFNGSEIKSVVLDYFSPDKCLDFDQNYECKIFEIFADFGKLQNFRNILTVYNDLNAALTSDADVLLIPNAWNHGYAIPTKVGPIFQQLHNWYIKYPSTTLRADYYLQPFERNLWFVIIFFLIFGTGLVIFQKLVKHKKFPIGTIFTVFEIFCNQNSEESEEISLRIVFLTLNMIGYVIVNSFGAVISAFLSAEIPKIPFNDLEGFVKNGEYKLLLEERGTVLAFLSVNDCFVIPSGGLELYFQSKLDMSNTSVVYFNEHDHVERYKKICSDGYLATESDNSKSKDPTYLNFPCAVYQITEPICKYWIGFFLAAYSPFSDSFNVNWLRFVEYGIKDRMKREIQYAKSVTAKEEEFQPVKVHQMTHILSIPLVGMISALLIITLEFFRKNRRPSEGIREVRVPKERRKKGRPRKSWMEGVWNAMSPRNLTDQQRGNRDERKLGAGQRASTV